MSTAASDSDQVEHYRQILRFEMQSPRQTGRKDNAIRRTFGLSAPQYYYQLHQALEHPQIVQEFPTQVRLLRERRDARARYREARAANPH